MVSRQCGQRERGRTMLSPCGRREMHTFRKLPKSRPRKKVASSSGKADPMSSSIGALDANEDQRDDQAGEENAGDQAGAALVPVRHINAGQGRREEPERDKEEEDLHGQVLLLL